MTGSFPFRKFFLAIMIRLQGAMCYARFNAVIINIPTTLNVNDRSVCGLGTAFKVQRLYKYVPHSVRDWKLTSTLSGCS